MSITEIEAAISELPPAEVDKLRLWLADYHGQLWNEQTTDDFGAGRFDTVIEEAFASGEPSPLTPGDIAEARRLVKDRITERNLGK